MVLILEVLLALNLKVLAPIAEEVALQLVELACDNRKQPNQALPEMFVCDEAVAVLAKEDREAMTKEREKVQEHLDVHRELRKDLREHRQARREARLGPAPKRAAKNAACPTRRYTGPAIFDPLAASHFDQQTARQFLPPAERVYLWRSLGDSAWNTHFQDLSPCKRSWDLYGKEGSLALVLLDAWGKFCDHEGVAYDHIPVKGLHDVLQEGA